MKKFMTVFSILLAAGFIMTASAQACPKKGCSSKTKVEKIKCKANFYFSNKKELGLSEEQVEKIGSIKKEGLKKLIKLQAEVDVIAVDTKSAMWQSTIDVDATNKLIDSKYEAKKALAKEFVKSVAEIKNVLDEKQKKQAKELFVDWQKKSGICPVGKDCDKGFKCPLGKDCPKGADCPLGKKGFECPKCGYKSKVCPLAGEGKGSGKQKDSGSEKKGS